MMEIEAVTCIIAFSLYLDFCKILVCKKKVEVAGKKNLKITAFLYKNKHTKYVIDEKSRVSRHLKLMQSSIKRNNSYAFFS